ncbi:uncharacterized protein Z520_12041 [Fonsecaea multimorphosa CBS 102226]|uniref:HAD-like protein n=1 Tax=Fonsecaea multimorphosa CBS 102226 TaxID=1442371 RepID=A0A0D2GS05_9EURO|nr:uncharacterized protein Z520_12041 [Fonsecaea multimorphosa CBS 102226]KIX92295.1 hypothetical protein Z520_12041 [Fonsecaea multimorphosa CBS 102226]OAL17665.1 hypothetical protein AYO22_11455 [Fonsecaea multimorphosa]
MATTEPLLTEPSSLLPLDTKLAGNTVSDPLEHDGEHGLELSSRDSKVQAQVAVTDVSSGQSSSEENDLSPLNPEPLPVVESPISDVVDLDPTAKSLPTRQDSACYLDEKSAGAPVIDDIEHEDFKDLPGAASADAAILESPTPNVSALIIDLGDVLCNWTAPEALPVSPAMLHRLLKTRFWHEYDSGVITQDECYSRLATQYGLLLSDVAEAFKQAAQSLSPDEEVFGMIRDLKKTYRGSLKVYLMSNIPLPEWKALEMDTRYDWTLFDGFFISAQVGMCKPELGFFRHVLSQINKKPKDIIFVDDNAENILAARSLGIKCLRHKNADGLRQFFHHIFDDGVDRGRQWLQRNAKNMWCVTPEGREVRDNFAQLFLYEAAGDLNLVSLTFYERTWNYYIEKPIDTVEKHPDDIDTTSLAMILLPHDVEKAYSILDEVLLYTNRDGIILTYFDNKRPRIDPAVCVNALRFFYKYGRDDLPALQPTKAWVSDVLFYRAYLDGTYYYPSGDVFLYLFSRLLSANPESDIYRSTCALLRERLQERIGSPGDAVELAMRVIACLDMGLKNDVDLKKLEALQEEDGGWPIGWLCQTGKISLKIGSRGVATALAVKAIEMARKY